MFGTRFACRCLLKGLLAIALASLASPAFAACPKGEIMVKGNCAPLSQVKQEIDRIVREAMDTHKLKAVLAGLAINDEVMVLDAWGESMTGVAATPDMHFRNGAVAIAYIGTVLLQLHDKKVLSVDDKLSKWFPEYPKADAITLTMLINGTAGYADYVPDEGFLKQFYADPFRQWTPDELVKIGLNRPMPCDPGKCWSYAHTNFVILGKVIEKAAGRPLEDLIRAGILDPLSLADTRSESTAVIQEPVLHAFDDERGRYEESTYWNPSWTLAKGAIMTSNIADILKSARAIGTGALLSPKSRELLLAPLTSKFEQWNDKLYFAFGVVVINGWIIQTPSFGGYAAIMAYLPSHDLALSVSVTLKENAPPGNQATEIAKSIATYLTPEAPL